MFKKVSSIVLVLTILAFQGCRTGSSDRDDGGLDSNSYSVESKDIKFNIIKNPTFIAGFDGEKGHYQLTVQSLTLPKEYEDLTPLTNSDNYTLYENGELSQEAKIQISKDTNDYSNEMMLLLDFSGSIVDQGCGTGTYCVQLVDETEKFIDIVVSKGMSLSIYYFNASENIYPLDQTTKYPTNSKDSLKAAINKLHDSEFMSSLQEYTYSTNLYGAIDTATQKLCSISGCDEDDNKVHIRSIVIFTDGKDTANLISEDKMLNDLRRDKIDYYTMGIGDADKKVLENIGLNNTFYSLDSVEEIFSSIVKAISVKSNLFLINFCPSSKGGGSVDAKFLYDDHAGVKGKIDNIIVKLIDKDYGCDLR